jgi:hypothetical protein
MFWISWEKHYRVAAFSQGETMRLIEAARTVALLCGLALAVQIAGARASENAVAQVKTSSGPVFVVRDGKRLPVKPGDPLYVKDVLQTDAGGSIGVTFTDNSVLSLGPGSEAALAEYSFDSSNFKGSMLTDMRKGTLTMVSGDIARSSPQAMKVRTPTAILGVRGTSFAVEVGDH